ALVAAMPASVLGGAALVLFGMVAATGIRSLAQAGLDQSKEKLLVVAVSLGVGLIPSMSDRFFAQAPAALAPFTHSGVLLGICTAVALNLFFGKKAADTAASKIDKIEEEIIMPEIVPARRFA
uniref:solute carrier family 23 protein n=9 Tax=Pseudomonadota TaxID=1224 RepID=UPI0030DCDA68